MPRKTLNNEISFSGVGLHSGKPVALTLKPALSGEGFCVEFCDGTRYSLPMAHYTGDGRGTILMFDQHRLMTVEHVLAALRGLGVDDVTLCPTGEEVPLLDGSALPYCEALVATGLKELSGEQNVLHVTMPVSVSSPDGKKQVIALPSERLMFTYVIDYGDTAISTQMATVTPDPEHFTQEIGQCRTFCLYEEVAQMRALGLGLGGTVETALIVKGHELLTPGGLRRSDEYVRHKILDMMGDLSLLGQPVRGHFIGIRSGHAMHLKLVEKLSRQQLVHFR